MLKSLTPVTLAALLALAAPLSAQDAGAAQDTQDAQQDAGESDAGTEEGLDLGTPVQTGQPAETGPQMGQRYAKEKHGDWDLACIRTDEEADPCSLLQILAGPEGNPMAEFSLFRVEQSGSPAVAGATIIVPLETLLPAALTISVDGAPGKRYDYSFCAPIGCIAQIGLTAADIESFKKGKQATLSLRPAPAPDREVKMTLSLKGFTAGYGAVDVVQK